MGCQGKSPSEKLPPARELLRELVAYKLAVCGVNTNCKTLIVLYLNFSCRTKHLIVETFGTYRARRAFTAATSDLLWPNYTLLSLNCVKSPIKQVNRPRTRAHYSCSLVGSDGRQFHHQWDALPKLRHSQVFMQRLTYYETAKWYVPTRTWPYNNLQSNCGFCLGINFLQLRHYFNTYVVFKLGQVLSGCIGFILINVAWLLSNDRG